MSPIEQIDPMDLLQPRNPGWGTRIAALGDMMARPEHRVGALDRLNRWRYGDAPTAQLENLRAANELYELQQRQRDLRMQRQRQQQVRDYQQRQADRLDKLADQIEETDPYQALAYRNQAEAMRSGASDEIFGLDPYQPPQPVGSEWEVKTIEAGGQKRSVLYNSATGEMRQVPEEYLPEVPMGPAGGMEMGKPGSGYVRVPDPESPYGVRDEPIPGTPEHQKRVDAERATTAAFGALGQMYDVLDTYGEGAALFGGIPREQVPRVRQLHSELLALVAQLNNAGVLQPGEMAYFMEILPDPTKVTPRQNVKAIKGAYKQLENRLRRKKGLPPAPDDESESPDAAVEKLREAGIDDAVLIDGS